jgi:hypothetical protein
VPASSSGWGASGPSNAGLRRKLGARKDRGSTVGSLLPTLKRFYARAGVIEYDEDDMNLMDQEQDEPAAKQSLADLLGVPDSASQGYSKVKQSLLHHAASDLRVSSRSTHVLEGSLSRWYRSQLLASEVALLLWPRQIRTSPCLPQLPVRPVQLAV